MKKKLLLIAVFSSVFSFAAFAGLKRFILARANPFYHVWICEGDVLPDRSAEPPLILVLSPENYAVHAVATVSLSLSIVVGTSSKVFRGCCSMASMATAGIVYWSTSENVRVEINE
jgi:hypothetical protein